MATTTQLRADITKLKKAIASKFTPKSAKSKLEAQLKKVEKELADKKSGKKTASTTASTQATFKSLRDLVRRTKELKIYKGSTEGDLQNDAERSALPSSKVKGRRISKGLRSNQFGDKGSNKGNVYYEYRKNRIDVKQPRSKQKYPILEDGGMMADGGGTNQKYVVYGVTKVDNQVKILKEADSFNLANNWLERYIDKGLDDEFEKMGYMPKSKFEKEKEFLKMADGGTLQNKIDYIRETYNDVSVYKRDSSKGYWIEVGSDYYHILNEINNKEFNGKGLIENIGVESTHYHFSINEDEMAEGGMMAKGGQAGNISIGTPLTENNIDGAIIMNIDHPEWGTWRVLRKYDDRIWEIRSDRSTTTLFLSEFKFWKRINYSQGGMAEMEMPNGGGIQSSTHKLTR